MKTINWKELEFQPNVVEIWCWTMALQTKYFFENWEEKVVWVDLDLSEKNILDPEIKYSILNSWIKTKSEIQKILNQEFLTSHLIEWNWIEFFETLENWSLDKIYFWHVLHFLSNQSRELNFQLNRVLKDNWIIIAKDREISLWFWKDTFVEDYFNETDFIQREKKYNFFNIWEKYEVKIFKNVEFIYSKK